MYLLLPLYTFFLGQAGEQLTQQHQQREEQDLNRRLREEQDAAFMESLRLDAERERQKQEAAAQAERERQVFF